MTIIEYYYEFATIAVDNKPRKLIVHIQGTACLNTVKLVKPFKL